MDRATVLSHTDHEAKHCRPSRATRGRRAVLAKRHTEEAERLVEEAERRTEEPKRRADLTDRIGGDTLTKALATAIEHEENK
jgi:hypothetical protein